MMAALKSQRPLREGSPEAANKKRQIATQTVEAAVKAVNGNIRARGKAGQHGTPRQQTIFRSAGDRPYTAISNALLQDPKIPYDVKGLVVECVSRPPDWEVSVPGILNLNKIVGEKKLHRMIRDAVSSGHFGSVQTRNPVTGAYDRRTYLVSDDPAEVRKAIERAANELDSRLSGEGEHHVSPHCHLGDAGCGDAANGGQQTNNQSKKEKTKQILSLPTTMPREGGEMVTALLSALLAAVGLPLDVPADSPFRDMHFPANWIAQGCDLALDILPTLRVVAARARKSTRPPPRGWKFFDRPVIRQRDARMRHAGQASQGAWQGEASRSAANDQPAIPEWHRATDAEVDQCIECAKLMRRPEAVPFVRQFMMQNALTTEQQDRIRQELPKVAPMIGGGRLAA